VFGMSFVSEQSGKPRESPTQNPMKKITILLAATLAGVAFSATNSFAAANDQCAACSTAKATLPVPISVVHPTNLPRQYENVTVQIELTIDENGVPHNVKPAGQMPKDLAARLLPAVSQWRFKPSHTADGKAIATTVVLPLELVEGADAQSQPAYAGVGTSGPKSSG
jgi:outer membrane biosynthesis protein TonB